MLSLDQILTDVDGSVGRGSGGDRVRMLRRLTDLFVIGAEGFSPDQVELFDSIIQRIAAAIETQARVELAGRLARLANAPPGLIASLAADDAIAVARPVLAGSPRLDDQTLMAIALAKGRDHMLAICDREEIAPAVTDVLVARGDGVVRHAIAGHPGARLSATGAATLADHARTDPALSVLLCERGDLPRDVLHTLLEIAKETARTSLLASLPGADREVAGAVERGATSVMSVPAEDRTATGLRPAVKAILRGETLTEADVARLAAEDRIEETLAAISSLVGLSIACLSRIFDEPDNDLLIVIGKARGWSWSTVRALLRLRNPAMTERHHFRRLEETFNTLAVPTATRVVHFLKVRETSGHRRPSPDDGFRF